MVASCALGCNDRAKTITNKSAMCLDVDRKACTILDMRTKTLSLTSPSALHAFKMLEIEADQAQYVNEQRARQNANRTANRIERDCEVNSYIDLSI